MDRSRVFPQFTIRRLMIAIAMVGLFFGVLIAMGEEVRSELFQLSVLASGAFAFLFSIFFFVFCLMLRLAFQKTDRSDDRPIAPDPPKPESKG